MDMEKVVSKQLIIIDSLATTKQQILMEMSNKLKTEGKITAIQPFLNDVNAREAQGMTGIGNGVAIPHGKSDVVVESTIVVATLKKAIKWETLDNHNVNLVFLFAVKSVDASDKHLLMLQQIAKRIAKDDFIKQVVNAKNEFEIYNLICK